MVPIFMIFQTLKRQIERYNDIVVISPKSIPIDIMLDILVFLRRCEVEKCQLLSRKWNQLVIQNPTIMPLYRVIK